MPIVFSTAQQLKVPDSDLIDVKNRPQLSAKSLRYASGEDASRHVVEDKMGFTWLDQHSRIGVITWNGIEIALYFRRKLVPIPAEPIQKVTTVPIAPSEAWLKIDLLESNPRKVKAASEFEAQRKRIDELERARQQLLFENKLLLERVEKAEETRDAALHENRSMKVRLQVQEEKLKKLGGGK